MNFYHGGQAGLRVHGFILPPRESGARDTLLAAAKDAGLNTPARDDVVYVTTLYDAAVMFAALHPSGGAIYRVRPIGALIEDPDCKVPGESFECERAQILEVIRLKPRQRDRWLRHALGGSNG